MTVEHVELLVEEPSMEAFLRGILPRILKEVSFEVYPSQSKKELLLGLPARLRAYAKWLPDLSRNRSRSFKSFYGALVEMVDS
jgi:hypothetical protein